MKIRVVYNSEVIVTVVDNDNSTSYYPDPNCCMVEDSDEIKTYLGGKGYDTTLIDEFVNS